MKNIAPFTKAFVKRAMSYGFTPLEAIELVKTAFWGAHVLMSDKASVTKAFKQQADYFGPKAMPPEKKAMTPASQAPRNYTNSAVGGMPSPAGKTNSTAPGSSYVNKGLDAGKNMSPIINNAVKPMNIVGNVIKKPMNRVGRSF
jgi:hypothetical protein